MAYTKVTGTLVDIGDLDLTNVGQIQLDSIAGDADANTSITFSGSDVITIATGGETQVTFNNGSILPTTDNDVDLGSSSLEFKDGYFDGTLYADAIDLNGTNLTAFDTDAAQVFNESGAAVDFRVEGDNNANLLFVDGSADRVGIGTNSPANNLHIFTDNGDEGILIKSTGDTSNAIVSDANRGNAGATLNAFQGKWNGTAVADISFLTGADTTNKDDGHITFSTASAGSTTEAMRISSSGTVLIGATTVSAHGNVNELQIGDNTGNKGISINSANDGTGAIFFADPDSSLSGQLEYAHASNHLAIITGGAQRLRIDSDGLKFGSDSASANALNKYEEGTFTPTFSGATLSAATGTYTRIGNQVTVHFRVVTSGGLPSSGGQVQVGILPFAAASGFGGAGSLYVGPSNVSSATGGGGTIVPFISGSEDFIRFVNVDTGTLGYTLWGELEVSSNNVVTAIGTQTYQV